MSAKERLNRLERYLKTLLQSPCPVCGARKGDKVVTVVRWRMYGDEDDQKAGVTYCPGCGRPVAVWVVWPEHHEAQKGLKIPLGSA